jgi:hypothetical protein
MKIEKDLEPSYWKVSAWIKGIYFNAIDKNKLKALDRIFEKIYWNFNLSK